MKLFKINEKYITVNWSYYGSKYYFGINLQRIIPIDDNIYGIISFLWKENSKEVSAEIKVSLGTLIEGTNINALLKYLDIREIKTLVKFFKKEGFNLDNYCQDRIWSAIVRELILNKYEYVYYEKDLKDFYNEDGYLSKYDCCYIATKEIVDNKDCKDLVITFANSRLKIIDIIKKDDNIIFITNNTEWII